MDAIFVDADVVLDFLLDRAPFAESSAKLFTFAEKGQIRIAVSALSFNNLYYVIRRLQNRDKALRLLRKLEKLVTILPVDDQMVKTALTGAFSDFEDELQHVCAERAGYNVIVTRNVKDYAKSTLSVHTPETYRAILAGKDKM